jgi:DNA-binding transcriptional LysR family regulator
MLSLYQLRALLAVAQTGSVGRAAGELMISQPAVSSALGGLQRALGTPVVEREGRGTRLTPAGERLVVYGHRILALMDEALTESRAAAVPGSGRVRLAAVTTAAEQLLPMLLSLFREIAPEIDVVVDVANKGLAFERLGHWEADIVLAGRPPQDGRFRTVAVRSNTVVVIGPPGRDASAGGLAQMTWLLREPGSGTRETTRHLLDQLGIDPPAVTIGSNGAIRECVRAGLGVSVLSRDAVARELAEGTLAEIATAHTPLVRDWHLVTSADREPPPGAQRFVEFAIASGAFRTP